MTIKLIDGAIPKSTLYSIRAYSRLYGIAPKTVYAMLKDGRIPVSISIKGKAFVWPTKPKMKRKSKSFKRWEVKNGLQQTSKSNSG